MPVEPRPSENQAAFMERCIATEREAGFDQQQAVAICASQWEQRTDAEPPQGVREAAQQGLDYRSEHGRGGTDVGIARARDLANGENIPPETLARMRSFFARHEQNRVPPTEKTEPDGGPTNGWIAWLLWGGDAGKRWAESMAEKNDGVVRVDFADQPIRMTMTDEGYLTGQARVARVGIQSYQDGEGGIRREFRPVGEVFSADAIASFRNMPVTMGHPQEGLVTADNAKRLSVGHVGENIRPDGEWLVMPITITDAETIEQIANGVVELSGGYMADLDESAGEYDGEVYDAVQRNIRGNHVAVVQQARAGEMARLNLDAAGAVQIIPEKQTRVDDMSDKSVTVRVDGIEYEVSPEVERHMTRVDEQVTALTTERDQAKADAETSKAKADEAVAELEKLRETYSDQAIREAAKARVALERTAGKILGDEADLDGMSERDLQEAVVKAVHADADLTEASDVYVQARFDAAVETHKVHADASTEQRKTAAPKADAKMKDPRDSAVSDIREMYKNRNGMTKRQNSN